MSRTEFTQTMDTLGNGTQWRNLPAPEPSALPVVPERYVLETLLGQGGMGQVWRAFDRLLGIQVALKLLRPELGRSRAARDRFIQEARLTASLEHSSIVPVFDLGRTPEGIHYYTMRFVVGDTLEEMLDCNGFPRSDITARQRVTQLTRVCEALATAHRRRILHRDIKPANIVLADIGDVWLVDWGIAHDLSQGPVAQVAGTPRYMAPEQKDRLAEVAETSDVYSLGLVLRELLTGSPDPMPVHPKARAPKELLELASFCCDPNPNQRPRDAAVVLQHLRAWLDGARKREGALHFVHQADDAALRATTLDAEAEDLQKQAESYLLALPPHLPATTRHYGWDLEDAAQERRESAHVAREERIHLLYAALSHLPDLPEARQRLAEIWYQRHLAAEKAGRDARAEELGLRTFDEGRYAAWLEGKGTILLATEPPDAEVEVFRFHQRHRRLVPRPTGIVKRAPLAGLQLPHGSYLLELRHPGRETVRFPIQLGRCEQVQPYAKDGKTPVPIHLPPAGTVNPRTEAWVPGGWFLAGGDPSFGNAVAQHPHFVGDVIWRQFPVTLGEYIRFLDDLVAQGRTPEALRFAPTSHRSGEDADHVLHFDGQHFTPTVDTDGDRWDLRWPAIAIDVESIYAFIDWTRQRTGLPWRLPREDEWERAVRGADGRQYPWGNFLDASWACIRSSHNGRHHPPIVGQFDHDLSMFGVRELCGGVREVCKAVWPAPSPSMVSHHAIRGASWLSNDRLAPAWVRGWVGPSQPEPTIGFRLVRDPPSSDGR